MNAIEKFEKILMPIEDIELILLKGHLLMEEAITDLLRCHMEYPSQFKDLRLSFEQKTRLLLCFERSHITDNDRSSILKVNSIRNKLAHKVDFTDYHDDLIDWACKTLDYTPKTIKRKKTYRNIVIKAFAIYTAYFTGAADGRKAVKISSNQSSHTTPASAPR